jgi:hypothetical protein
LSKKELEDYNKNKIKSENRVQEIAKMIEDKSYHNNVSTLLYKHLEKQSIALKKANPELSICHVHDRGCDSVEYLEFIKETLKDDVVVRAKKTRNSEQTRINPQTNRRIKVKLIDSKFANNEVYPIDKMTMKGKQYHCKLRKTPKYM